LLFPAATLPGNTAGKQKIGAGAAAGTVRDGDLADGPRITRVYRRDAVFSDALIDALYDLVMNMAGAASSRSGSSDSPCISDQPE
jgi:hypothetical protein